MLPTRKSEPWSSRQSDHTQTWPPQDLLCPFCNTAYEDEMHILFYCKSLNNLRQKYIPRKYVVRPSVVTLRLSMQDESCLYNLGRFIYHSDKRRDQWSCPQQTFFLTLMFSPLVVIPYRVCNLHHALFCFIVMLTRQQSSWIGNGFINSFYKDDVAV